MNRPLDAAPRARRVQRNALAALARPGWLPGRRSGDPVLRAQAGFTLVELAVATAVMMLALLLACDLLEESGKLLHHSARRARDPLPLLATELLRNDLRAAVPPGFSYGIPEGAALPLELPTGLVVWGVEPGGRLVRSDLAGPRTMLQGVAVWNWQALPGGAIEVEIGLRTSGTWLSQTRRGVPRPDAGRIERTVIVVAGRGRLSEW